MILVTLLVQGFTLPPLIQLLGVDDTDEALEREELEARRRAAEGGAGAARGADRRGLGAATTRPSACAAPTATGSGGSRPAIEDGDGEGVDYEERSESYQRLTRELLEAQRSILIAMRNDGDDQRRRPPHRLERELDLEDSRLEI